MKPRIQKIFLIYMTILLYVFNDVKSYSSNRIDRYCDAVSLLKKERQKMKKKLEIYKNYYSRAMKKIKSLNEKFNNFQTHSENEFDNLKKLIAHNDLVFQQGRVGYGQECNYMKSGTGDRTCKTFVKFAQPFKEIPKIHHSAGVIDGGGSSIKINIFVTDLTNEGFNINVLTWGDSHISELEVDWMAVGK